MTELDDIKAERAAAWERFVAASRELTRHQQDVHEPAFASGDRQRIVDAIDSGRPVVNEVADSIQAYQEVVDRTGNRRVLLLAADLVDPPTTG